VDGWTMRRTKARKLQRLLIVLAVGCYLATLAFM
jgi:hypothetical protein